MYFDGEIPDYRLIGKLNPDKTHETPDLSGLTCSDCTNTLQIYISSFKQTNKQTQLRRGSEIVQEIGSHMSDML